MRSLRLSVLAGMVFVAGCSSPTSPSFLNGAWQQDNTFPGSSLQFTLNTNGSTVSGSGSWSGEACCNGVVTITGTQTGVGVNLTFDFVTTAGAMLPPRTSQFTGSVVGATILRGTFASGSSSTDVSFHRTE